MNTTSTDKKNLRHLECLKGQECLFLKQKRCFFWHPRCHRVCNKDGSCENPRCEFKHPKQGKKAFKGETYSEYASKIVCRFDGDCWKHNRGQCPFKHLSHPTQCIVIPKPKQKIESKVSVRRAPKKVLDWSKIEFKKGKTKKTKKKFKWTTARPIFPMSVARESARAHDISIYNDLIRPYQHRPVGCPLVVCKSPFYRCKRNSRNKTRTVKMGDICCLCLKRMEETKAVYELYRKKKKMMNDLMKFRKIRKALRR